MQNHHVDAETYGLFLGSDSEKWRDGLPALAEIDVPDKGLIYRQGERCSRVFCIIKGIVKLSVMTLQGNEMATALLKRGEIFGCLQSDPRVREIQETAQAVGEVRAYQIDREEFKALLSQEPRLSWWFVEALCARRQQAERKLQNILTQSVEMRVLGTLKELAEMFGVRCVHGYALEIRLTQQDIADLVGASRSVVSTILNVLRRQGMLDYTRDLICINDPAFSDLRKAE
jgi:CRP-like cAMP-binding protein